MREIIDGHMHLDKWGEADFINCFEEYRKRKGLKAINVCAIPMEQTNVCNNIMVGFYKLAHENTYAHGGIELIEIPIDNMPQDMNAVTQYKELMEIGFDGIKMLEGKPTEHKRIGKNLNHDELNKLYAELEKDGTHLLMHANDPDEFWDEEKAPGWAKENGWAYLDGSFSSFEEIQTQAIKILEMHPRINLTFAHFFFCGKYPQRLEELFSKYPNMGVDLTPGSEMYFAFEANHDFYKEFFEKYSTRLNLGTDGSFPPESEYGDYCLELICNFIQTTEAVKCFDENITGLGLSESAVDNILHANFERRVGKAPKPMNKEKFKAYIEKYSFALTEQDLERIKPLCEKYL